MLIPLTYVGPVFIGWDGCYASVFNLLMSIEKTRFNTFAYDFVA